MFIVFSKIDEFFSKRISLNTLYEIYRDSNFNPYVEGGYRFIKDNTGRSLGSFHDDLRKSGCWEFNILCSLSPPTEEDVRALI